MRSKNPPADSTSPLEKYRAAAQAAPDSAEAQSNLGWGYYGYKQFTEAESQFRRALELDMNYLDAYWGLGLARKALGARDDAIQAFERVAALATQLEDVTRGHMLIRLAHGQISQLRQGNWNLGKEIWQKA